MSEPDRQHACFLHVPKAGGSFVNAALEASLPRGAFHHARVDLNSPIPLRLLLDRYLVVSGHFTFAHLTPDVLESAFVFTFLREPVDRAVSLYSFYRDQQTDTVALDHRIRLAQSMDLATFVDQLDDDRMSPWSNWQTFIFSGAIDCERPATDLLPVALQNLDRIDFVGTQDDLRRGLEHLAEMRGWTLALPAGRVNVTRSRAPVESLPSATVHKLARLNACDAELVAHARARWAELRAHAPRDRVATRGVRRADASTPARRESGSHEITITNVSVDAARGVIAVQGRSRIAANDVTVGIRVTNEIGLEIYGVNTRLLGKGISTAPGDEITAVFEIGPVLGQGRYTVTTAIHGGRDHLDKCYHWIENAVSFTVNAVGSFSGLVDLKASANIVVAPPHTRGD